MNKLALTLLFLITCMYMQGQDTLPKFSVRNIGGNRIIIDWRNKFDVVKQISIQRSFDSLKNFKTILTVPDPGIPQNGYADTKAPSERIFYRLYILLDNGFFIFSDSKRPVWDTAKIVVANPNANTTNNTDTTITQEEIAQRRLAGLPDRPSLSIPVIGSDSTISGGIANNRIKVETWAPSKFVYTFKDGYIRITLPDDDAKSYSIKFFTQDDKLLFELKDIKEKSFKLDKANFYKAGWFKFELYEDGKLKEKNKFYLPKEF